MHATIHLPTRTDFPPMRRGIVDTLQVNLGYRCNQSCLHCHVNAGPHRTEEMTGDTVDAVVAFLAASPDILTLDLTGGAPELNRHFRRLVIAARSRGIRVIDRCNLTILEVPGQEGLERDYEQYLATHFGVVFNQLFTLVNMPIQRFGSMLVSKGQFNSYMELLRSAHRDANLDQVMCRSLVSVDWQGYLYDCDFNQQLGLPIHYGGQPRTHLSEITAQALQGQSLRMANHCFGCTAGQGSSCGGALAEAQAASACAP